MNGRVRRVVPIAVLAFFLAIGAPRVLAQSPDAGGELFEQFCASCHTIGGGDSVGPDLEGVTTRRDETFLERIIVEPDQLVAEGDPIATELVEQYGGLVMPNLGITPEQAAELVAFMATASGDPVPGAAPSEEPPPEEPAPTDEPSAPAEEPAPTESPATPTEGDPERGKDLFLGSERFENEGASCASCHTMSRLGSLGGGTVGPDLTGAYERFGDGYIGFLASGTMASIFDERPLTAQEEVDLTAFMAQAAGDAEPSSIGAAARFAGIGLGGFLLLAAIGLVIWRDRLGSVRKRLIEHATTEGK